jgi:hypothetical protein
MVTLPVGTRDVSVADAYRCISGAGVRLARESNKPELGVKSVEKRELPRLVSRGRSGAVAAVGNRKDHFALVVKALDAVAERVIQECVEVPEHAPVRR